MKTILTLLTLIAVAAIAHGQTTKTLTLGANGTVQKPSDFWAVNSSGIASALSLGTAATANSTAFATAAQGALAATAVQPSRTISTGTGLFGGGNLSANLTLTLDPDLVALAAASGSGLWAVTGNGTGALRSLSGQAGYISITNADGQGGNPTITIGANVVTTDTTQTITANKTFSGNLTLSGNTILGDAAADTVTVNAATITAPNASGATAYAVMTRQLMPLESILGASRMVVPFTNVAFEQTGTFSTPLLIGSGVRFQGGSSSANGTYSGAAIECIQVGVGSGNVVQFTSRFALEWTYSQGTNHSSVVFTVLLGSNDRRNLTGRGVGLELNCGTGAPILKAHDGTTQGTAVATETVSNLFYRRYILVWDGVRTLTLYRGSVNASSFDRPAVIGSVQISANATGTISGSNLRFGFWATGTVPFNQDAFVQNVVFHRF